MVSEKLELYCSEDPSLIENYDKAINDNTQTWVCHHRLENELKVCRNYLLNHDLYFNRPASELILLTREEHCRLHSTFNRQLKYYASKPRKRKCPDELKKKASERMKQWWELKKQGLN